MRDYLIDMRKSKNWSQQFVAEKLGITRQYYSYIEAHERQKKMNFIMMKKLSDIFGISIQTIIDFEDELALKYANAEIS